MPLRPRRAPAPTRYYYFAYGSNVSLKQMAERCPSSLLMGRGRIDGFRWQINERGVANIVEATGRDFVEGLVYQIGAEDRRKLDRNEGVSRGYYDDDYLPVRLTPLPDGGLKTFHAAREMAQSEQFRARDEESGSGSSHDYWPSMRHHDQQSSLDGRLSSQMSGSRSGTEQDMPLVDALVYVSRRYMSDGVIRDEYVGRMEKAISDARRLGLSDRFLNYIDDIIHQVPEQSEDSSGIMSLPDGAVSQGHSFVPSRSYGPQDAMDIHQQGHDRYEVVNIIERAPGYPPQISRSFYPVAPYQQDDDQYNQRLSRAPSCTRDSRRGRRPSIPSETSHGGYRNWIETLLQERSRRHRRRHIPSRSQSA